MATEGDAWCPEWRVQRLWVLNQWQEWQMTCSYEAGSWPRAQRACCWVRSFPAPYQGELKRGSPSLFMDVNLGVLNVVTAKRKGPGWRRIFLSWQILLWLSSPKRSRRMWKLFNLSKEGNAQQYAVRKSLRKKLRSWGPEHLRSVSCSTNTDTLLWRNNALRKLRWRLLNILNF